MAGYYIFSERKDIAAELIGFVKGSGKAACVITFSQEAGKEIQGFGADTIYVLKGDSQAPENCGKAVAEFLKKQGAELFLVGATVRGRDFAARVAGYLGSGMVSDAASISVADGKIQTERSMYGGAVSQTELLTGLNVITVAAGKYEAVSGQSEIATLGIETDTRVSIVGTAPIDKKGVDLGVAGKVVGLGMGLNQEEDLKMCTELAQAIDAGIGCTRGLSEEKQWLPTSAYIGISGVIIKPSLYLALGVSGQVQHVFGVRDSKIIVAINTNEKAPIFKAADYGIVGDMYEVIPLLISELRNNC